MNQNPAPVLFEFVRIQEFAPSLCDRVKVCGEYFKFPDSSTSWAFGFLSFSLSLHIRTTHLQRRNQTTWLQLNTNPKNIQNN